MIWLGLWHINHCRSFNAKSSLHTHIKYIWFGCVLQHINHYRLFNAKSSLFIHLKYIWFGWVLWHINHCMLFTAKPSLCILYINRLSIIRKSDLTDKVKRSFFHVAVVSILLYGCTTWTLTKRLEKKLDGNYTRMLRAILNKSWRQHPTRHQLYDHLPPIMKTIQTRRTRHAGHCWRSRDELISDVLLWPGKSRTTSTNIHSGAIVRIREVALKTCQRRWTIGKSGERGSGISVLVARQDDEMMIHDL